MDDDQGSRKRWYALMALAIFLHVLAMTNSDLGLDAHVRLNAAMDGQHDGQDLAWGKLRIADSSEQAPTNEQVYDGYIAPWFESELAAKFTAFVGVLCVACLAGLSPRWASPSQPFNPMKPALILFSPIFLFVSARGYDEGVLAFVAGFGTVGFLFNQGEERAQRLLHVVMMAASVMLVLGWKGFSPIASIGAFLLTVAVGAGWLVVEEKSSGALGAWLVHPWKMASLCALLVFIGVMVVGFMADTGTFAIIGQHPVGFVFATTVALIHSVGPVPFGRFCALASPLGSVVIVVRFAWTRSNHAGLVHRCFTGWNRNIHRGALDAGISTMGTFFGRDHADSRKQRTVRYRRFASSRVSLVVAHRRSTT